MEDEPMISKTAAEDAVLRNLRRPCRNNYFYGKLLDVFHFELEQNYINHKRWLLNRLALGYGVLCGLRVYVDPENPRRLRLGVGVAIDKWGREIIVPAPSRAIDPFQLTEECGHPTELYPAPMPTPTPTPTPAPDQCVHLCLAYHECESELTPMMVGECEPEQRCVPSVICEQYMVLVRAGSAPPVPTTCPEVLQQLFAGNTLNYDKLVAWTLQGCQPAPSDPCVVLANVSLPGPDCAISQSSIDMAVRPIVYSNRLLFDLILCLAERCGIIIGHKA
jgi:hypothetical protein